MRHCPRQEDEALSPTGTQDCPRIHVETPQAEALAQKPADQANADDGGDGFISLCYINVTTSLASG